MTIILPRRQFLVGIAASLFAAPAIVRAGSLMAIRPERTLPHSLEMLLRPPLTEKAFTFLDGMTQSIVQTLLYGNPISLNPFCGFAPAFDIFLDENRSPKVSLVDLAASE